MSHHTPLLHTFTYPVTTIPGDFCTTTTLPIYYYCDTFHHHDTLFLPHHHLQVLYPLFLSPPPHFLPPPGNSTHTQDTTDSRPCPTYHTPHTATHTTPGTSFCLGTFFFSSTFVRLRVPPFPFTWIPVCVSYTFCPHTPAFTAVPACILPLFLISPTMPAPFLFTAYNWFLPAVPTVTLPPRCFLRHRLPVTFCGSTLCRGPYLYRTATWFPTVRPAPDLRFVPWTVLPLPAHAMLYRSCRFGYLIPYRAVAACLPACVHTTTIL